MKKKRKDCNIFSERFAAYEMIVKNQCEERARIEREIYTTV